MFSAVTFDFMLAIEGDWLKVRFEGPEPARVWNLATEFLLNAALDES